MTLKSTSINGANRMLHHEAESHRSLSRTCFGSGLHCLLHIVNKFLQHQGRASDSIRR